MSFGIDTYAAYGMCRMVKQALDARGIRTVIAPPVYWGIMDPKFPGSFAVRPATMKALLTDIFSDLKTWGFRRVYVINRHGDRQHRQTLNEAMAEAVKTLELQFYNHEERKDWEQADKSKLPEAKMYRIEKPFTPDYHAGAFETAVVLAYFPEEVNLAVASTLKPQATFDPLGYVGDPANYRNANGRVFELSELGFVSDCLARWMERTGKK
jgi:creatinine amidohydrolase